MLEEVKEFESFNDLLEAIRELDKEMTFSFVEYSDGNSDKYNYIGFSFGWFKPDDYSFTINFKTKKVECVEIINLELPLEEIIVVYKIYHLLQDNLYLIKETFRGSSNSIGYMDM